jgi:hypothetical protein
MGANRTREIRPSGMTPEACGNMDYESRIEARGEIFGLATEPQGRVRRISIQPGGLEWNSPGLIDSLTEQSLLASPNPLF